MRLLGENLVMFRDSQGRLGALEEYCPHRGASLYFGRNEEGGLRCAYHGWKFDITGECLDTPTEPVERREKFCAKIKAKAYPCHEVNHMIWIYMGTRKEPPPFPAFEINTLPADRVGPQRIMGEEANYLQNMEGDLDSAHLDWVHRRLQEDSPKPEKGIRGFWNPTGVSPVLDVVPTEYGAYYSAKRILQDGSEWHRVNQFIFPFHTMITTGDGMINLRSFVPVDDEFTMLISLYANPAGPLPTNFVTGDEFWAEVGGYVERTNDPRTYFLTKANKRNDYGRDLKVQEETMFCGIPFVGNLQDRAMTELMTNGKGEPIYDRQWQLENIPVITGQNAPGEGFFYPAGTGFLTLPLAALSYRNGQLLWLAMLIGVVVLGTRALVRMNCEHAKTATWMAIAGFVLLSASIRWGSSMRALMK